ncbi:hypothetical protein [Bacillus nakamurai]|uniref:hypothetical protein n=1 Tax=Bacillus nakamurai TaxID=1793963 RepID=UPI001E38087E|nr:hypothetical protein [Bacillus nakamurai]MCC9024465.1 hypothetical protein [Bacillus nakamurai]
MAEVKVPVDSLGGEVASAQLLKPGSQRGPVASQRWRCDNSGVKAAHHIVGDARPVDFDSAKSMPQRLVNGA